MTNDEIAAIAARLAKITPGEWISDGNVVQHVDGLFYWRLREGDTGENAHADFIASAPADIKRLLAQYDADQARIAELEALIETSPFATHIIAEQKEAILGLQSRIAALEAALHEAEKHHIGFERSMAEPDGYHFCSLCGEVAEQSQLYTTIKHKAECPYRALEETDHES